MSSLLLSLERRSLYARALGHLTTTIHSPHFTEVLSFIRHRITGRSDFTAARPPQKNVPAEGVLETNTDYCLLLAPNEILPWAGELSERRGLRIGGGFFRRH